VFGPDLPGETFGVLKEENKINTENTSPDSGSRSLEGYEVRMET
jgi:hypothetical protein